MNDRIALGAAVWVSGILAVQWAIAPVREPGKHRAKDGIIVPLDDLLGEPSAYTHEFEHAPSVIGQGFRYCPPCGRTAAGSLNKDGWLCGECLTPAGAEAAS